MQEIITNLNGTKLRLNYSRCADRDAARLKMLRLAPEESEIQVDFKAQ